MVNSHSGQPPIYWKENKTEESETDCPLFPLFVKYFSTEYLAPLFLSFVIIASMVGTTVSVFVFIIRTGLVCEKGWTMKEHRIQRRDAGFSALLMFIISAAVMITAAVRAFPGRVIPSVLNRKESPLPVHRPLFCLHQEPPHADLLPPQTAYCR